MERPETFKSGGRQRIRPSVDGTHAGNPLQLYQILRGIIKAAVDGVIQKNDLIVSLLRKLQITADKRFVESLEKCAAAGSGRSHNSA